MSVMPGQPQVVEIAADAFGGEAGLPVRERRRLLRRLLHRGKGDDGGVLGKLGMWAWRCIQARRSADAVDPQAELAYMVTLANNLPQRKTLEQAACALSGAGVEAIVYKGHEYLDRIYGDVGARTMADVDLLIRPADLERTHAALVQAGFQHCPDPRTHHEFKFVRNAVAVDVHTQLISGNRMRIEVEALFQRSLPARLTGLRALEATDAALVHCIAQTVKGYHVPASSYYELQWLLARADHAALRARAIAWRACACLYASMRALCDMGNRGAAMLVRRLPVAAPRRAVLDQLVRWCSLHTSYATQPPRALLLLAKFVLVDRARDGLRFVSQWATWQMTPPTIQRC